MRNKKGAFFLISFVILAAVATGVVLYSSGNSSPSITGSAISGSGYNSDPMYYTNNEDPSCGDYGQQCCNGICDQGECQGGMCIHCGYFGETCCYNSVDGKQCDSGSVCTSGRCQVTDDYNVYNECGHIGFPPCQDDYGYYCSYGVLNYQAGVCEHCGFLEQPCCPNTDYECDYGTCTNGICKTTTTQNTNTNTANTNTNYPDPYEPDYDPGYDDEDYDYDSGSNTNTDPSCGGLNEDCCEVGIQTSMWGGIEAAGSGCDDDLECRGGACVTGPVYESSPRGGY